MRSPHFAVLLAVALAGCQPANNDTLSLKAFHPAAASFRAPSRVTVEGTGFDHDVQVRWGDASGKVLSVTPERLEVELPAVEAPRRAPLRLSRRGAEAASASPYVGWVQPADSWHLSPGQALPVPAAALALADLDGDGVQEFVVTGGRGTGVVHAGDSPAATWLGHDDAPPTALSPARLSGQEVVLALTGAKLELFAQGADGGVVRAALDGGTAQLLGNGGYLVQPLDGGSVLSRLAGTPEAPALEPLLPLGSFEAVSVTGGDVDGDGNADLLLGGRTAGPRLLLSDGKGHFREAAAGALPATFPGPARLADLDADGQVDVVVAGPGGDVALRQVDGRFVDRTQLLLGRTDARAAFEADLDGDAAAERVGGGAGLSLLHNDGAGAFYDYTYSAARPWSAATPLLASDADGDGDADLLVREPSGVVRWLLNLAPTAFSDADGDGVDDAHDNCPAVPNPDQLDTDAHPFSCADLFCADKGGHDCRLARMGGRTVLACGKAVPFAEAQAACRARGGRLVLPLDEAESKALGALAADGWVDLTDAATEGTFLNSYDDPPTWSGWSAGQPDNAGGKEDCAEVRADGTWNDLPCDATRPFACVEPTPHAGDGRGDACDSCPLLPDPAAPADACGGTP